MEDAAPVVSQPVPAKASRARRNVVVVAAVAATLLLCVVVALLPGGTTAASAPAPIAPSAPPEPAAASSEAGTIAPEAASVSAPASASVSASASASSPAPAPAVTTASASVSRGPLDPRSAAELHADAQAALDDEQGAVAFELASLSWRRDPRPKTAELMLHAACMTGHEAKIEAGLRRVRPARPARPGDLELACEGLRPSP